MAPSPMMVFPTHARRLAVSLVCSLGITLSSLPAQTLYTLDAPAGTLRAEIKLDDLGGIEDYPSGDFLYYRLLAGEVAVVDWSPLGIEWAGGAEGDYDFFTGLAITGEVVLSDQLERFELQVGKRRSVEQVYNQLMLTVENARGHTMILHWKAFDDGIGFRYEFRGDATVTLIREHSGFRLPTGTVGYLQEKDFPGLYAPNYQDPIERTVLGVNSPGNGYVLPGLFALPGEATWMLFHESGLTEDYYGAHLAEPNGRPIYRIALPNSQEGNGVGAVVPTSTMPFNTPWRIFAIGSLAHVVETSLIELFAEPYDEARFGEIDWIRPGKSAWSWWSQDIGTPDLQREYIDFAASQGWEYSLVDSDWVAWDEAEQQIQNLVDYAADRGVKLNLWYNSGGNHNRVPLNGAHPRDRMLDPSIRQAELDKLASWGIAGIKVDYFFSDKQDRIQQYIGIMEDALERGLLVNFHGCTVPRGWVRTYPNLMTMEAVDGAESYKWPPGPDALQNVRYTFTRNVVGSMDYTPLTFAAGWQDQRLTYAHQLALGVVFESGIQHFADQADGDTSKGFRKLFADNPGVAAFLTDLPTAWDETWLLEGHPDSHAVWARERNGVWYLGAISGSAQSRTVSLDLSLFGAGAMTVESFTRGATGTQLSRSFDAYASPPVLNFNLAGSDGFVLRVSPAEDAEEIWWDYPVRPDRWIDTGAFLGWIYLHPSNWVYLLDQEIWIYFPSPSSGASGGWAFFAKP